MLPIEDAPNTCCTWSLEMAMLAPVPTQESACDPSPPCWNMPSTLVSPPFCWSSPMSDMRSPVLPPLPVLPRPRLPRAESSWLRLDGVLPPVSIELTALPRNPSRSPMTYLLLPGGAEEPTVTMDGSLKLRRESTPVGDRDTEESFGRVALARSVPLADGAIDRG